jgi:choline kinase
MKTRCTTAVILAAGCGSRVRSLTSDRPKCLMDLAGVPIIEWIIGALERAGITEIAMVTGFRSGHVARFVAERTRRLGTAGKAGAVITLVRNPRWRLPNGLSLYAARRVLPLRGTFLVLMSDHILPPGIVSKVARAGTDRCVLAVDTNLAGVFDLSDATKVRTVGGRPVAIGKLLRKYDAVDCGLFRFDARVFAALGASFKKGDRSLSGGVRELIAAGDLDVVPIGRRAAWIDIDTPKAYRQALRNRGAFLRGHLKRST